MKTLTVKLPDDLALLLEKQAKRSGVSKSALVRESIEKLILDGGHPGTQLSVYELVQADLGCVDSGLGDLSSNPAHMEGFGR